MKAEYFKKEILQIEDEVLRKLAIAYLEVGVPEYFWEIPASLSGLYHPIQDHGPQGLLRHTRMCMTIAIDLLNLDMYQSLAQYKDEILIALLIHDSWKCGVSKRFVKRSGMEEWCTIHAHPKIAAQKFSDFVSQFKDIDEVTIEKCKEICKCAETHMGQWTTSKYEPEVVLRKPQTPKEKFVHMCDYLSSRGWIGDLTRCDAQDRS